MVEAIKPLARSTSRPGADAALGGFGGLFDLKSAGFKDPVLVAATDGVGTKLRVALEAAQHDTVGIDLVAMCVNDLIVQGAEPLFFLDYYACGQLETSVAEAVVTGIANGCKQAGCALIGGETAEMPGMYDRGDYDLAGFAVGAAERGSILTGGNVSTGDVILGLESSGLHSNGFSLVRRVVEAAGLNYADKAPFSAAQSLGEALLTPTRIYVRSCLAAIKNGGVRALAHITGGGLSENLPRVLPGDQAANLKIGSWPVPSVFDWLAREGGIDDVEMQRTFNCGIGMAIVVDPQCAAEIQSILEAHGETVHQIGTTIARGAGAAVQFDTGNTAL